MPVGSEEDSDLQDFIVEDSDAEGGDDGKENEELEEVGFMQV